MYKLNKLKAVFGRDLVNYSVGEYDNNHFVGNEHLAIHIGQMETETVEALSTPLGDRVAMPKHSILMKAFDLGISIKNSKGKDYRLFGGHFDKVHTFGLPAAEAELFAAHMTYISADFKLLGLSVDFEVNIFASMQRLNPIIDLTELTFVKMVGQGKELIDETR